MIVWNSQNIFTGSVSTARPGNYGTVTSEPIDSTEATELVTAGANNQYLTICNDGPDSVLLAIGSTASATNYNVVIPPGYNERDWRLGAQSLSAICKTGKTATLKVAIAPEIS